MRRMPSPAIQMLRSSVSIPPGRICRCRTSGSSRVSRGLLSTRTTSSGCCSGRAITTRIRYPVAHHCARERIEHELVLIFCGDVRNGKRDRARALSGPNANRQAIRPRSDERPEVDHLSRCDRLRCRIKFPVGGELSVYNHAGRQFYLEVQGELRL